MLPLYLSNGQKGSMVMIELMIGIRKVKGPWSGNITIVPIADKADRSEQGSVIAITQYKGAMTSRLAICADPKVYRWGFICLWDLLSLFSGFSLDFFAFPLIGILFGFSHMKCDLWYADKRYSNNVDSQWGVDRSDKRSVNRITMIQRGQCTMWCVIAI